MARMYGSVQGSRGPVHRLGGSSLFTIAATWQGAVRVHLWVHRKGKGKNLVETDMCEVRLTPWNGSGVSHTLYNGPVGAVSTSKAERAKRIERILRARHKELDR